MVDKASIDINKVALIKKRQFKNIQSKVSKEKDPFAEIVKDTASASPDNNHEEEPKKPGGPNIPKKYITDDQPQIGLFRPLNIALKKYCAEHQLKMKNVVNEQMYKFLKKEKALPKAEE